MEKRKGSLLQRMLAVLLPAVLIGGMAWEAVPASVLAAEPAAQDNFITQDGYKWDIPDTMNIIVGKEEYGGITGGGPAFLRSLYSFESSDEAVATVRGEGIYSSSGFYVKGVSVGTATITFTCNYTVNYGEDPKSVSGSFDVAVLATSGDGWTLDADGKLTIETHEGMLEWEKIKGSYKEYVTSAEIKGAVGTIESGVFENYEELTSVEIQTGVEYIKEGAFSGCTKLEEITIPDSVTSIGDDVFSNCNELTTVIVKSETPPMLGSNVFGECGFVQNKQESIYVPDGKAEDYKKAWEGWAPYIADTTAENTIIVSGDGWALAADGKLKITSDDGMADWIENENGLSANFNKVTRAEIQSGVTSIKDYAFGSCIKLKEITIPGNVTKIGEMAFAYCTSLQEINLPSDVTDIGLGAFYESGIKKIAMQGTTPPVLGEMVFSECRFVKENLEGIEVPSDALDTYKEEWEEWASYIKAAAVSADSVPPTGAIKIEPHSWNDFLNTITFGLFFKETKSVTIEAADEDSGVDRIYYYISDSELSETEVKALGEDVWTEGDSFFVNPDRACVIYAKITDMAGNTAYLSSDGLVFDGTAPVIRGVTPGEVYLTPQTVTVTDDNLESVKVNGRDVTLSGNTFILEPAATPQTIVATDKAGNTTTVTVTVTVKTEPGNGTVETEAVTDGKSPAAQISMSVERLAEILLTEEEKQQMTGGMDIRIVLDVKDASESVSAGDRTLVEKALKDTSSHAPQYLDISLFKVIGGSRSTISETKEAIVITIKIPENLKNSDGKRKRTFSIIRVHGGVVETLKDLDDSDDTITIATDRFSTYAIAYQEAGGDVEPTKAPGGDVEPTKVPGGDIEPTKAPGGDVEPTKVPGEDVEPTKIPGGNVEPTKVPGGDIEPTNPGGDVRPTGTPTVKKDKVNETEKRRIEIHSGLKTIRTEKSVQVSWGSVNGADGYKIYVQKCGKDFGAKPLSQVKGGGRTRITVKKINGRKLDTKKNYKLYVEAYRWKDGKKITVARTMTVHIAGRGSKKYTNVKKIRVKKTSYVLKRGGALTLKPEAVLFDKRKKQLSAEHTKEFRYISSNGKVAAVTAGGKVKAKGSGNCAIYVFAKNGCKRKIKIKVGK